MTTTDIIDRVADSPSIATTLELIIAYERMLSDLGRLPRDANRAALIDEIHRRADHGDETAGEYWAMR
jgi:hypothetical protein